MVKSILLGKYCFKFVNQLLCHLFPIDGMSIILLGEWNNINFDFICIET